MAPCSPLCPCSSDCISSFYFFIILHLLEQNKDLIWYTCTSVFLFHFYPQQLRRDYDVMLTACGWISMKFSRLLLYYGPETCRLDFEHHSSAAARPRGKDIGCNSSQTANLRHSSWSRRILEFPMFRSGEKHVGEFLASDPDSLRRQIE